MEMMGYAQLTIDELSPCSQKVLRMHQISLEVLFQDHFSGQVGNTDTHTKHFDD